jgi:hypothetical protein
MTLTFIWTTVGALLTLCVYSFLYKDNPFYKFAEHLVVGVSAGYYLVIYYFNFIDPNVVRPVFQLELGGEAVAFGGTEWWMALIPGLLGLLLYTRFFPKIAWVGRWPLGIYVGGYAGLGISPVMQARVIDQMQAASSPLAGVPDPFAAATNAALGFAIFVVLTYFLLVKRHIVARGIAMSIGAVVLSAVAGYGGYVVLSALSAQGVVSMTNILLVVGLLGTLAYFFFSMRHAGLLGGLARIGIIFLMVGFGASFGYTVMSRISLLIGRVSFLLTDWLHLI